LTCIVRPFRPEDRAAIIEFQNRGKPSHLHETVAEWERMDARRSAEDVHLRLCIGEPAVAFVGVRDLGTVGYRTPGTCWFKIYVSAEYRRSGLGGLLYEQVADFARERGAERLRTPFRLFRPDEPAIRFLAQRGLDRELPILLDLTQFDPAPHTRLLPEGLRLWSLAETGDTEVHRRKLYALDGLIFQDIPTHDVLPERPQFDEWNKRLEGPEFDAAAILFAENVAGEWVGLNILEFQEHTGVAWTGITGVRRDYRGQGVALALKLRGLEVAKARGCTLVLTENHEDNAAMRAINKKLGFTPDAPGVTYVKTL
jgi:mycothiol synthase